MIKERPSSQDPIRAVYETAAEIAQSGQQIVEGYSDKFSIYRIPKLQLPSLPKAFVDHGHLYVALLDSTESFGVIEVVLMLQARIKGEDKKAGFDVQYHFDQPPHKALDANPFYVPNTAIGFWGDHVLMDFAGRYTQSRIQMNIVGIPDDIMDIMPSGKVTRQFIDTVPMWKPEEIEERVKNEERYGKISDTLNVPSKKLNILLHDCMKHIKANPENNVTGVYIERIK